MRVLQVVCFYPGVHFQFRKGVLPYFQYLLSFSASDILLPILGVWLVQENCKDGEDP